MTKNEIYKIKGRLDAIRVVNGHVVLLPDNRLIIDIISGLIEQIEKFEGILEFYRMKDIQAMDEYKKNIPHLAHTTDLKDFSVAHHYLEEYHAKKTDL